MATLTLDPPGTVHRPRNVDWKRAAALLYGDWGTSKAYVIGLAFVAAGFSSFPIILAVCVLTGLVANQLHHHLHIFPRWRWRLFRGAIAEPVARVDRRAAARRGFDGHGGAQRLVGVELLQRSASESSTSFSRPSVVLFMLACINYFGPKHSGSVSPSCLALPAMIVVIAH